MSERSLVARVAARYKAVIAARILVALPSSHQRGWEHRKEQDERASNNIPPEHLLAWNKLKKMFKGTPDQRAEQFMEYLEANPGDSDEMLQEKADKDMAKMIRENDKERRVQEKVVKECDMEALVKNAPFDISILKDVTPQQVWYD